MVSSKMPPMGLKADGTPRKSRAGRPPVVESRGDRQEILEALFTNRPNYEKICREKGLTMSALRAFERRMMPPSVRQTLDSVADATQVAVAQLDALAEARKLYEKLSMLADGFHRWLLDPEDPTRYTVSPRDNEVTIIWEKEVDMGGGKVVIERHRDTIAALLQKCRVRNEWRTPAPDEIRTVEVKFHDPRKGMIELFTAAKPTLEMLGKALGQIRPDPPPQVNVFLETPDGRQIVEALYEALRPCPKCLNAAGQALKVLSEG